jgi:hypothetical protein
VRAVTAPTPDRPPVEQPLSQAPGGRSAPPNGLAAEIAALAELLAETVVLARQSAVYPGQWEHIAELALEHGAVRAALRTEQTAQKASTPPPLTIGAITTQLNELHDLIGDDHGRS